MIKVNNDYKGAVKDYFKAVELGYEIEKSYANLGYTYTFLGEFTLARIYLKKALELNPNDQDAIDQLFDLDEFEKYEEQPTTIKFI